MSTWSNDEQVSLSAAADGPRVEVGTLVADFGFVRQGLASAPISLALTNTGTKPVKYLGPKSPSPNFTFGPATTLAPGTSTTVEVAMTQGSAGTPIAESAALVFAETLCNTPPEISLKGQRVANDLIVSPGTVELGDVECTSTAPKNSTLVTISNYSANAVSYASDLTDTTTSQSSTPPARSSRRAARRRDARPSPSSQRRPRGAGVTTTAS